MTEAGKWADFRLGMGTVSHLLSTIHDPEDYQRDNRSHHKEVIPFENTPDHAQCRYVSHDSLLLFFITNYPTEIIHAFANTAIRRFPYRRIFAC